jgi:hypothetical protein
MKIIIPSFPSNQFQKIVPYKTWILRLQHFYADEKLVDHLIEGGNYETFQAIISADPTYQEFDMAYQKLSELRKELMRYRKKRQTVSLEIPDIANKWLNFYLQNKKEIEYRYGKTTEEEIIEEDYE